MKNLTYWERSRARFSKKTTLKTFAALGLSSLLPSFAFSEQGSKTLESLLATTPQSSNDSKVKNMENYSPVVDLRGKDQHNRISYDQVFENGIQANSSLVYNTNENVLIRKSLVYSDEFLHFTANNKSQVNLVFDVASRAGGDNFVSGFMGGNFLALDLKGDGLFNIVADNTRDTSGDNYAFLDYFDAKWGGYQYQFLAESSLKFIAKGHISSFLRIAFGMDDAAGSGQYAIRSPYIEINMKDAANLSSEKYVIYNAASVNSANFSWPDFFINANDDGSVYNKKSIQKYSGDFYSNAGRIFMYLTTPDSFVDGNFKLGNDSSVISFSGGSTLKGNIDFTSPNTGDHTITFDQASFEGVIKDSTGNDNRSSNTTIIFTNTNGKTFGSAVEGVVDSTYKGAVTGSFDVSASSTTNIMGGSSRDKGFLGSGTNILFFDFKGNAASNISESQKFSIGGGNANSVYTIGGFQSGSNPLDLSSLSTSDTLYTKISNAGINIKSGAAFANGANTNNVLQGILFFQTTNMKVGTDANALFANQENIIGTGNDLNGLTLGAMFGNAIWNDTNKNGYITADEITANAGGANYKLSSSSDPNNSDSIDNNTSTGNIGSANDSIKKQVAFIFADGTYDFEGDKQGYSGAIAGGTTDSKYYFANAGYVTRTQISNAQGELVLFNTAFRGDLGVKNESASIMLDFSNNRNGFRAEKDNTYANIVGSGNKNITFNFTGNTQQSKFTGAVVGNAASNATAKYTMLNLKKYTADDQIADNDGRLTVSQTRAGGSKTLIDAIQEAGLTNFNKALASWNGSYPADSNTDISNLSTSKTTLALRGTSLDATNIDFSNYIYDFAFGEGLGDVEGVVLNTSKLKGVIDLTGTNTNSGHSFVFKGTAIEGGESGVLVSDGKLAGFSYDDSSANYDSAITFKLSGLTQSNYVTANASNAKVTGDTLLFAQTNLEGNLWADNSVAVNLNFTDGRTWKMDSSGFYLKSGSNIVIHGRVENLTTSSSSVPKLQLRTQTNQGKIELINTGANLVWKLGDVSQWNFRVGESFDLRGTSLSDVIDTNPTGRIQGVVDSGYFNFVFAKGSNVQTTVAKGQDGTYYNITEEGSNNGRTGSYANGVYDGNYIAESFGKIRGFDTLSGFNLTFVGDGAWDTSTINNNNNNFFKKDSKLTLINASSNSGSFDATKIGYFFLRPSNDIIPTATINIEGTSISNGNNIVARGASGQQALLNFNMTFIKDSDSSDGYVSNKYADIATTTANGALSDSVLKVAQSSLSGGIDFKNSNFNVLFVGNGSQTLSSSNTFKGSSATSIVTFRDSDLNAGNGTSSIQNIRGTIAFDLTHKNEDMSISGTLKNMLADDGRYQVSFTAQGDNAQPITIERLVFVDVSDIANSNTLGTLNDSETSGYYFGDKDTFGSLAQADYFDLAFLTNVDTSKSSSLTFANSATVALTSGEVVFVGAKSHQFGSSEATANKLGDSTNATLTFIDAGELKVANLVNAQNNIQQGKGTINLIGSTSIELQDIAVSGTRARSATKTLTLYNGSNTSAPITGEGITINAIFTGNNALAQDNQQAISDENGSSTKVGASTANIGQAGEQTIYHLLFDYTSSDLTFGTHHTYTGNIYGLTSQSVIKFKNAGYINQSQIENTQATILVDNTQIKGDFRGDNAVLDFRNNHPAISGNILTSDTRSSQTPNTLSQKTLTFDLTGSNKNLGFAGVIQAGYRVAPTYGDDTLAQSILTFQNASDMTLGDDTTLTRGENTNPSDFIKSLANDVGFSGIGGAKIQESQYTSSTNQEAFILQGTKLLFQGTNIVATNDDKAITENTYSLDLSFDASENRGSTGLGETLKTSKLTANSIAMGELSNTSSNTKAPLSLSLSFKNQGSLIGATKASDDNSMSFSNVLDIKLKDNAVFNLNTSSDNGNIGTLILSKNQTLRARNQSSDALTLSAQSSINIAEGSMNFVGVFDTSGDSATSADKYGSAHFSFNGDNKAYGLIKHKGNTTITLRGNALLTESEASVLGFVKSGDQFADLVIDASVVDSGKTLSLNLAHTSGMVGVIGTSIANSYTSVNLNGVAGNITLKGNFDLGQAQLAFTNQNKSIKLIDNTALKVTNNGVLNFQGDGLVADTPVTLTLNSSTQQTKIRRDFTFVNIDPNITVELKSLEADGSPNASDWGVGGSWNFRGTNLKITSAFWSESNAGDRFQSYVFAKGNGRDTAGEDSATLDALTTNDKINVSALTGEIKTLNSGQDIKNLMLKNAQMTFIGKESFGIEAGNQKIDGTKGKITFGFYNGLIKSGYLIFDNTNNGPHPALGAGKEIQDVINLSGTDTFNLSVAKMSGTTGANNSTINAVFINGTTHSTQADTSITGVRYIDPSVSYASAYATGNAGGALTQTQLKTLESKAYGNITMDNTVTANMKFIGENSHSFDGKVLVKGSGSSAEFYSFIGSGEALQTSTEWSKLTISNNGAVSLGTKITSAPTGSDYSFATLSGGNSNSRFDFDHTSVKLDLIKSAGGKTYVYNSNVIGNIAVSGLTSSVDPSAKPNQITPSTTLFFNAKMGSGDGAQELTSTAENFINSQFKDALGINLDLSTARTLNDSHLANSANTPKKLGATTKQTNLVLIGKGSVTANSANSNGDAIDLSFLPDSSNSANYAYTIISGGLIEETVLANAGSGYEIDATIFGNSKVQLVDTYVTGARDFAQVGFINTNLAYNQRSSWGGGADIEQYLIFDMGGNAGNKLNQGKSTDVITNQSSSSHYIFSNLNIAEPIAFTTDIKTTLNTAMSSVAPNSKKVIADDVVGTLGLRGVSVKGNISDSGSNGIDIVFNSTSSTDANQGIAYKEWFNSDGSYQSAIVSGEKNLVSHGTDYESDPNISGYAVLYAQDDQTEVTISGNVKKKITFIGENSVSVGFDKLKISQGSVDSNYTFHTVGELSETFLKNVGLQGDTTRANPQATLGNFTFINSAIIGNINVDQNTSDTSKINTLTFDNVSYSGTISGNLKKNLLFGVNTNHVAIIGGSNDSIYDFSNLSGQRINLSINMSNGGTVDSTQYAAPTIKGFESGDISLVGSLKLAKTFRETNAGNDYINSFAFNDNASWIVTDSSRVMNLTLSNTRTNYNLDLASASRASSVTQDGVNGIEDHQEQAINKDLRVLEVGNLSSDAGQVLLGTMINTQDQSQSQSDKIKANVINSGTLYITAQDVVLNTGSFDTSGENAIVLVSADAAYGEVVGAKRKQGLSYVNTELEHQVNSNGGSDADWVEATQENTAGANSHRWVLSSFKTEINQGLVDESGFIVSNPYRMLTIETNNLNKRMGDLRDDNYNQGAWIRVFNGSDSADGAKNLYTNIQLGYDYGTPAIGAKNYTGVAFSTSIVDIDGKQYSGKANTYSLATYNAYIADSGLYVDTIAKYLYIDQKITPSGSSDSIFGSHALSLGVEVGYRAYMGETNFYIEPQAEVIGEVIFGVKDINMGVIGGMNVAGELKTITALNTRVGLVQGYSLKTQNGFRADFRLGVSLINEAVSETDPIRLYDGITEAGTSIGNNTKAVVNVGTNLILTDQWRVYIDAEKSFGGSRNTDYQANIGARFSFGDKISSLPKVEKPLPLKPKGEEKK